MNPSPPLAVRSADFLNKPWLPPLATFIGEFKGFPELGTLGRRFFNVRK